VFNLHLESVGSNRMYMFVLSVEYLVSAKWSADISCWGLPTMALVWNGMQSF